MYLNLNVKEFFTNCDLEEFPLALTKEYIRTLNEKTKISRKLLDENILFMEKEFLSKKKLKQDVRIFN